MFLEILWSLKGFAAEFALVRLQGDVNPDMRRDMIALDCSSSALTPSACQVEIIGRLAADMSFADVFLISCVRADQKKKKET